MTSLTAALRRPRTVPDIGRAAAAAVRPVVARIEPLAGLVSPLGWTAIGALGVTAALGWNLGWVEMRAMAIALAAVLVVAAAWLFGSTHYDGRIDLDSGRVRIGEQSYGRVVLRNTSRRPTRGSRVEMPVGRAVASFAVARLAAGEEYEEMFQVPARRRSVIPIGPVRTVTADPLGLFRRERPLTGQRELFVHPRIVRLETTTIGFLKDIEGIATQNLSSSDVSFHALREYVPGDDRRSIHWRTTARVGRLMVRQFEETMRSHLLILLSLRPEDYRDPEDFELAVSVVGSIGMAALRDERRISVYTSAGPLEFTTGTVLLDQLCRVEPRANSKPLREFAAQAAAGVPSASVTAVVTGGNASAANLRGAQLALPAGVSTFAVRCDGAQETTRRRAAGLTVLDIATLEDLPRGLRTIR